MGGLAVNVFLPLGRQLTAEGAGGVGIRFTGSDIAARILVDVGPVRNFVVFADQSAERIIGIGIVAKPVKMGRDVPIGVVTVGHGVTVCRVTVHAHGGLAGAEALPGQAPRNQCLLGDKEILLTNFGKLPLSGMVQMKGRK